MPSPAQAFKIAQEAALRGSAEMQAAMNLPASAVRLYTEVPANAPLPYCVLGDDQVLVENTECAVEAEIYATIGVWSRLNPLDKGVQARAIGAAVIAALNLQLAVHGWDVDEWAVQDERYSTDPDQSTHGVLLFKYLLTEQV